MSAYPCQNCGKPNEYSNYCDWDCHVAQARKVGGKEFLPNGLPVGCIRHDGNMYEHEHGDHPTYMFPVEVKYTGNENDGIDINNLTNDIDFIHNETHALIYACGNVALTMYETCPAMWYLHNGEFAGGSLWKKGEWKLSEDSLKKIKKYKV